MASPFIPYSNIPEVTTSTSTSHTRTWSPTSTIGCLDPPTSSFAVALASKAPVWHFPPDAGWRALGFHPWPCLHRENRLIRLVIFIVVYSFSRKERLRKPWCVWSVFFLGGGGVSISTATCRGTDMLHSWPGRLPEMCYASGEARPRKRQKGTQDQKHGWT